MKNMRLSNIELLRIMSMVMVVIHHFICFGVGLFPMFHGLQPLAINSVGWCIADAFVIVGVNCFVLISGFFKIKLKWKSLLNIISICIFFRLCSVAIDSIFFKQPISFGDFFKYCLFIFEQRGTYFWFIRSYLLLLIIAPILNRAFDNTTRKFDFGVFFVLSFINVYLGFFRQNPINTDGYNLSNFIYIYYIGHIISKYKIYNRLNIGKWGICYVVFSISIGILACALGHFSLKKGWLMYNYNSPLVLLSAFFLFNFFCKLNMSSKIINKIGSSCLAVYLFHEQGEFREFIYGFISNVYNSDSLLIFMTKCLCVICLIFLVSIALDNIRKYICKRPIEYLSIKLTSFTYNIASRLYV